MNALIQEILRSVHGVIVTSKLLEMIALVMATMFVLLVVSLIIRGVRRV